MISTVVVEQCILHKPLMMVIPPEGVRIPCDVHKDGHFVKGRPVAWAFGKTLDKK